MRKPKPHFYRFPTAGLFADYRKLPATELNAFRAARAFLAFGNTGPMRLAGVLGAWPMLPVNVLREVLPPWKKYSRTAAKTFGTPVLGQFRQCVRLALNDGPPPGKYYIAGLAGHSGGMEIDRYIHDFLHRCVVDFCRYAVVCLHGEQPQLADKMVFEEHCRTHGIACIETFIRVGADGGTNSVRADAMQRARNAASVFVKPARGAQGKHAERWDRVEDSYISTNGISVPGMEALVDHVAESAAECGADLLIQEAAVNTAAVQAYGGRTLSTVRIVTLRSSDGTIRPVHAATRIAGRAGAAVDNYHSDGAYFYADYRSGEIGLGTTMNFPDHPRYITNAPLSDIRMTGRIVEGWDGMRDLAIELHGKLTLHTLAGWDIALTDRGPVAVECNSFPGMSAMSQRPYGGFLGTEYSGLLRDEVVGFLDRLAPPGSRIRFSAGP